MEAAERLRLSGRGQRAQRASPKIRLKPIVRLRQSMLFGEWVIWANRLTVEE